MEESKQYWIPTKKQKEDMLKLLNEDINSIKLWRSKLKEDRRRQDWLDRLLFSNDKLIKDYDNLIRSYNYFIKKVEKTPTHKKLKMVV